MLIKVKELREALSSMNEEDKVAVSYFHFSEGEMVIAKDVRIEKGKGVMIITADPV